jgi:hypothetical protein
MVPVRDLVVELFAAIKLTVPFPVPEAPDFMLIHEACWWPFTRLRTRSAGQTCARSRAASLGTQGKVEQAYAGEESRRHGEVERVVHW